MMQTADQYHQVKLFLPLEFRYILHVDIRTRKLLLGALDQWSGEIKPRVLEITATMILENRLPFRVATHGLDDFRSVLQYETVSFEKLFPYQLLVQKMIGVLSRIEILLRNRFEVFSLLIDGIHTVALMWSIAANNINPIKIKLTATKETTSNRSLNSNAPTTCVPTMMLPAASGNAMDSGYQRITTIQRKKLVIYSNMPARY